MRKKYEDIEEVVLLMLFAIALIVCILGMSKIINI